MIGIVLWSDPYDRKAVFWCEDQGDLAYFEAPGSMGCPEAFFNAGDMVQFSVSAEQTMRLAHEPTLLEQSACTQLPETLKRATPDAAPDANATARIIPFKPLANADALSRAARKA